MRIIAGTLKGRRLVTPKGASLRPTSDRVKESMFNILGAKVDGGVVLDLFAGTGNLGIEALSRGARRVVFIENSQEALGIVRRNLQECRMQEQSEVLPKDVDRAIGQLQAKGERFDLIFMDPPYEKGLIKRTLNRLKTEKVYHNDSVLVVEHTRREPLPELLGSWNLIRQRRIGDTVLSFLTPGTERDRFKEGEDMAEGPKGE